MALADQKCCQLTKEVKKIKEQNLQLIEANEVLQYQLSNRDKEIKRLSGMLEGGRPLQAIKKDCGCKSNNLVSEGALAVHEELNKALQEKSALESRLKDSLAKQHEAMTRALHLAERNKILEKEMKDIDHLALEVEAECNNTVKSNAEKVNRLQDQVNQNIIQMQNLEKENARLRQEKEQLTADLNAIGVEKKHLQTVLETSLEDKKRLQDKINNFTIIENDLNMEIDRLTRLSAEQKAKIAEIEAILHQEQNEKMRLLERASSKEEAVKIVNRLSQTPSPTRMKSKSKKKTASKKSSKSESPIILPPPSAPQAPTNTPLSGCGRCCTSCCDACASTKHLKELLEKELKHKEEQSIKCIDNLRSEKEYYMKEYHKMLEQLKNLPLRPGSNGQGEKVAELTQKLAEKEQSLTSLQHENKMLSQEKFNLMSKLSGRDMPDTDFTGPCGRPNCKRTERERDLLRGDLEKVEEDRDSLKQKLRGVSDSQMNEQDRLKKRLMEAEDQVHKLEQERRELVQSQGSRRATLNTLEEQCNSLKDQLRAAQNELSQQRAVYNQLKTLHEQTDLSLSDTQSKLMQAETELASALDKLKQRDLDKGTATKEVELLKNDLKIMKCQLAQIDGEKDELLVALDDKTEKLARLEAELRSKEKTICSLESTVNELKKKLNMAIDESSNQEHSLRNSQTELATLRQELESVKKIKESAIHENRRLQDDLSSVTCDCRDARKELELYKRQVEDLKTQLQHYVAEIKRAEDMMSNKEIERNELLDQFRSLSHEANILENSNHTLENEATQSRVQLSVALDHAADLERKLENKESIIVSYEKQIADLTSQIASLEIQLRQFMTQYERSDVELQKLRDMCVKLETENAKFKRQVQDRDNQKPHQSDRNADQFRSERELIQQTVQRDRRSVENVEGDLHDAKHEINDLRLLNQDLQEEVQRLKIQIQDLRDKFQSCCDGNKPVRSPSIRSRVSSARSSKTDSLNTSRKLSSCNYECKSERGSSTGSRTNGLLGSCLNVKKIIDERKPLGNIQETRCDYNDCNCDKCRCESLRKNSRNASNDYAASDISIETIESSVRVNGPDGNSHVAKYTVFCEPNCPNSSKSYLNK